MRNYFQSICLVCLACISSIIAAQPAAVSPALAAYVEGLDAMSAANWKDAIADFDKALQGDSENPAYFTARGVAKTLAEDFPSAQKDFARSLRLRPNDKETRMWQAVAERLADWYAMVETGILYDDNCPREYAIFIFNDLVISYHKPGVDDGSDKRSREKFPRAGAWFADLAFGRPEVKPALYLRAKKQAAESKETTALSTVDKLLALSPEDTDGLRQKGWILLQYGDAASARTTFTRVLTAVTTDGDAYAGRAIARARIGDVRGANEDYQLAKKNGSKRVGEAEKIIADSGAPPSIPDAAKAFRAAIESGNQWDDLVAKALTLRCASNNERRRYDQWYQSRMRVLEQAAKDKPRDADAQVNIAEFLFTNSDVRGEQVEPRSGWRGYRYQTEDTKAAEIQRSESIVDNVLKANPKHLRALGLKVRLRLFYGQNADAAQYYDQMIKLGADDPASNIVYAEMIDALSWQKANEAATLSSQNGSVTYSGDWMTTTYLTDEGWRQVREKQAMADQFAQLASQTIEKAAKALKGTPRGNYYQAKVFLRAGNGEGARAELEQAIKSDPEYIEAFDLLAAVYAQLGNSKKAFELRVAAWNKMETSAGLILPIARQAVVGTHFKDARGSLDWALNIDPVDARIYTYYGVSLLEDEKRDDGMKWMRGALAMEEARAKQQGTTYQESGKDTRTLSDFGLSMAIRERMIDAMKDSSGVPSDRLGLARANALYEGRVAMSDWTQPLYSAMIPSMTEEVVGPPPQVPEGVEHLAQAHVSVGDALFDMGKFPEAEAEYQSVFKLQDRYREFVVNRATNNGLLDKTRWAAIGLGFTDLKLDKYNEAVQAHSMLPAPRFNQTKFNDQEKATAKLAEAIAAYKSSNGILTEQEKQYKEIEDMNAANQRMRDQAIRDMQDRNKEIDEQRRKQMEAIQNQRDAQSERRRQIEQQQQQRRR